MNQSKFRTAEKKRENVQFDVPTSILKFRLKWHHNRYEIHYTVRFFCHRNQLSHSICCRTVHRLHNCDLLLFLRHRFTHSTHRLLLSSLLRLVYALCLPLRHLQSFDGARLAFVINKIIWSILIDSLSHFATEVVYRVPSKHTYNAHIKHPLPTFKSIICFPFRHIHFMIHQHRQIRTRIAHHCGHSPFKLN